MKAIIDKSVAHIIFLKMRNRVRPFRLSKVLKTFQMAAITIPKVGLIAFLSYALKFDIFYLYTRSKNLFEKEDLMLKDYIKLLLILPFFMMLSGFKDLFLYKKTELETFVSQIQSVIVYDLKGRAGESYSQADLQNAIQSPINPNIFQELVISAKYEDKKVQWKGGFLIVVKMKDGTEKRLAMSDYIGVFKFLGERGYFYLETEAKERWIQFFDKILNDDFIPKREERNRQLEAGRP